MKRILFALSALIIVAGTLAFTNTPTIDEDIATLTEHVDTFGPYVAEGVHAYENQDVLRLADNGLEVAQLIIANPEVVGAAARIRAAFAKDPESFRRPDVEQLYNRCMHYLR